MHYYIDGYNLLFRAGGAGVDLKRERESVIASFTDKIIGLEFEITLVFDAQYQPGLGSRSHVRNLEICYTDEGETADAYILKRIKSSKNPRLETVVTSDHQLSSHVRRLRGCTMEIKEFLQFLDKKGSQGKGKGLLESNERVQSEFERWLKLFEEKRDKE